jgi:hypothetical protein
MARGSLTALADMSVSVPKQLRHMMVEVIGLVQWPQPPFY